MPAARGPKTGINSVVYRNTATGASKYATPTWSAVDHTRDGTPNQAWDLGDAAIRATKVKLYHPTQKEMQMSVVVRCDDVDAGYLALKGASELGTALDMLVLDGPISTEGSRGFRSYFFVSESGQPQGAGDVLYSTFDLRPGFGLLDSGSPAYPTLAVTGASSAVTYTAI